MGAEWIGHLIIGIALPSAVAAVAFLALLGQERTRLALVVEYYRAIKVNADKERAIARKGTKVTTKIRDLEADAIKLLRKENLIRFVEKPKESPPEETPPSGAGA